MGKNRLPDETEFICEACNEDFPLNERCLEHWNDDDEWVCKDCCVGCQEDREDDDSDMNPPDEGKGSIYVDPEGLR